MEQSGFLYKYNPKDYVLGSNSPLIGVELNPKGDWIDYRPSNEKQHNYKFDTLCCSTFSATSDLEAILNYLWSKGELSDEQINFCKDEGYIVDEKFNFSDRWSATSNRTTPNGQYITLVWDDFRNVGLIPEKDLPYGGKNQAEYLDIKNLTPERYAKAKRFSEMMFEKDANGKYKVNYEWVPVETGIELFEALKQAPIQVAVTKENPRHAIVLLRMDKEFDSYSPFLRSRNRTIAYALKPIITLKKSMNKPYVEITRTLSDNKQTLGVLEAQKNGVKLICKTLEIAWKNNAINISCIPTGEYKVKWSFSNTFKRFTYEITNVPGRSGIRIHPANYFHQLKGCIALGDKLVDMNGDGKLDITSSRITLEMFENFMDHKEFTLKIV